MSNNNVNTEEDADYDGSAFTFTGCKALQQKKVDKDGNINAWTYKIPKFSKGDMKHKLADTTSFSEKYPKYRGPYLKECYPVVKRLFQTYDISLEMNADNETLIVSTTDNTWDPYAILIARDIIKLICRSVPIEKAERLFDEGIVGEVLKIGNMVSDVGVFVKRRKRLVGENNENLVAIEKLLDVSMFVQGSTVAIIGTHQNIEAAIMFCKKVMKNVHPLYLLKQLHIFCELKKSDQHKDADWSTMLPHYTKTTVNKKKKTVKRNKKVYNPLPPAPLESKLDHQLTEGEYFVKNSLKKPLLTKEERKQKSIKIQETKRNKQYVSPKEVDHSSKKKIKLDEATSSDNVDVTNLKKKVKLQKKKLSQGMRYPQAHKKEK